MTTFHIGQRVRIARHLFGREENKKFIGAEGKVSTALLMDVQYQVLVHAVTMLNQPVREMMCMPEELEPINYDGNEQVEWKECLWNPEKEEALL